MTYKEIEEILPKYGIMELCYAMVAGLKTFNSELRIRGYDDIRDFYETTGFDFDNINITNETIFEDISCDIIYFKK
jgi:hypothetical protein